MIIIILRNNNLRNNIYAYTTTFYLFIHQQTHLGYFHRLASVHVLLMNMGVQITVRPSFEPRIHNEQT